MKRNGMPSLDSTEKPLASADNTERQGQGLLLCFATGGFIQGKCPVFVLQYSAVHVSAGIHGVCPYYHDASLHFPVGPYPAFYVIFLLFP